MSKSEVEVLDPQQKQLLEVVHECLQNGGQVDYRGKSIGCFVGVFGEDWRDLDSKDSQNAGLYRITGYGDFVLANRVSYEFDFKGPRLDILIPNSARTDKTQHHHSNCVLFLPHCSA